MKKHYIYLPVQYVNELCKIIIKISNRHEASAMLRDLLTPRELASVVERLQIIKQLVRGRTQRHISKSLGVSIDKVTRGSKALHHSKGGFGMLALRKKWRWWKLGELRD